MLKNRWQQWKKCSLYDTTDYSQIHCSCFRQHKAHNINLQLFLSFSCFSKWHLSFHFQIPSGGRNRTSPKLKGQRQNIVSSYHICGGKILFFLSFLSSNLLSHFLFFFQLPGNHSEIIRLFPRNLNNFCRRNYVLVSIRENSKRFLNFPNQK